MHYFTSLYYCIYFYRSKAAVAQLNKDADIFCKQESLTRCLEDECKQIEEVVETEIQLQINKNSTKRAQMDAAAQQAALLIAKAEKTEKLQKAFIEHRKTLRKNSQYCGDHNWRFIELRRHGAFGQTRTPQHWVCGCGSLSRVQPGPGGPCGNNVLYSQPTLEEYQASTGFPNGQAWKNALAEFERGAYLKL
jgi:hypothetical protein